MTYQTQISKGIEGWQATSEAVLGETPKGTRILKLRTSKTRGGLSASASVCVRKGEDGFSSDTTMIFQDFFKSSIAPTPCKRVTEKAIQSAHENALEHMGQLVKDATAFYEAQGQLAA
jgi:hypothetical protein